MKPRHFCPKNNAAAPRTLSPFLRGPPVSPGRLQVALLQVDALHEQPLVQNERQKSREGRVTH